MCRLLLPVIVVRPRRMKFHALLPASHFPELSRQQPGALPEQLRKAAGGGVANGLSDLADG